MGRIFKTSSSNVIMMKLFIFALVCIAAASAGDCDEPRPEYCAKNVHLCKVPGFIDFMKKCAPDIVDTATLKNPTTSPKSAWTFNTAVWTPPHQSWRRLNAGCNSDSVSPLTE